jgi:hypothetical protein
VEAFLGREVGEQGARTSGLLISWLRAKFAQCPPGEDDQTVQYNCRAWILHLFGCVLFPDGMGSLRRRCGSTSSLTRIRRVTTAGLCNVGFPLPSTLRGVLVVFTVNLTWWVCVPTPVVDVVEASSCSSHGASSS